MIEKYTSRFKVKRKGDLVCILEVFFFFVKTKNGFSHYSLEIPTYFVRICKIFEGEISLPTSSKM